MVYKFFDKKSKGSGIANEPNYQLANELHKPIIRKFKKRRAYSYFIDNIWGVDLADMQSQSKYNKETKYLLCTIDLFSKYAWDVSVKDKKGTSRFIAFKKIISKREPNKIWVDQGSEFYNNIFKDILKINNIEMYSTYSKGKSVVAERFIRTLKNKTFKHMTAISKNVYFDVWDDIVNKYNNTVHRTIKTKPIDVTGDYYAEYNENFNKKDSKFKVGDNVRISKHKNIFAKGYTPNCSEKFLLLVKLKIQFLGLMILVNWMVKKLLGVFMKKSCKKLVKKNLE